jgi:hypothetical protein
MLVLQQLVLSGSISADDTLYFIFKNYNFECKVSKLGLLYACTYAHEHKTRVACFLDRGGFSSLTDWADCCLQDLACEYVTRFSSWKRIRHKKSRRLLSEIRDLQREKKNAETCPVYIHLQKQLLLYQQQFAELNTRSSRWKEWALQQSTCPKDMRLFLEKLTNFPHVGLYVFPDMATLKQLAPARASKTCRKRKRSRQQILRKQELPTDPIAAIICCNDIDDMQYQDMLQAFFQSVSTAGTAVTTTSS